MASSELLIDPAISKAKFDREIEEFRKLERTYQERGWWLLEAKYPEAFVVLAAPQLTPPSVVFGVLLEFSNYDLWPPSVRIVDPFTRQPLKAKELRVTMNRRTKVVAIPGIGVRYEIQQLLIAHDPEDPPFLCIPGVREYHNHPGHTGNPWLLHRKSGAGTFHFLLEQLYKYGIEPLKGYQFGMQILGFHEPEIPE